MHHCVHDLQAAMSSRLPIIRKPLREYSQEGAMMYGNPHKTRPDVISAGFSSVQDDTVLSSVNSSQSLSLVRFDQSPTLDCVHA